MKCNHDIRLSNLLTMLTQAKQITERGAIAYISRRPVTGEVNLQNSVLRLKYKSITLCHMTVVHWNRTGTSNSRGNWNHIKTTQKISEQRNWKARQGTTESSHTGHCAHTSKGTNVKVQKVLSWEIILYVTHIVTCLGTTWINQNSIAEEIKSRLRSGNACYHSVQNLLSSRLLSKNLKIKIYRTIILPVVLYGCEDWSLTLREERKLRVF